MLWCARTTCAVRSMLVPIFWGFFFWRCFRYPTDRTRRLLGFASMGTVADSAVFGAPLRGEQGCVIGCIYGARSGELLLEKGAELETKEDNGAMPLSYAVGIGDEAVVKLLLENGAELETKDEDGRTPLSFAAGNCYNAGL
jgi:hypothetical protein